MTHPAPNIAIAAWAVLGVSAIIGNAIVRLTPLAVEAVRDYELSPLQLLVLVGWTAGSLYSEGYKGFQKAFAPRVVARAMHLARHPRPLFVAFAPLFAMSFFHAKRSRLIFTYAFLTLLICMILTVQTFPQPWRGIVDVGVVAGLVYGVASMLVYFVRAIAGHPLPVPADLPEEA